MAITTYRSPNGQTFQLHPDAVPVVEPFFNRLNQVYPGYQSAGGYAHRPMRTLDGRNLGGLSTHATGYTLDVKAPDPVLRQMAQEFPHLRWGGKFSHYDPVHFEFGPTAKQYGELPPLNPASLLDPKAAAPTPGPQPPAIAPSGGAAPMTPMQPMTPMTPYSGPSPDDVAQQRRMAQMLMQQATSTEPVGHWTQALARVVQGGVGGMYRNAAQEGERQITDAGNTALMQALGSNDAKAMIPNLLGNPGTREIGQKLAQGAISAQFAPKYKFTSAGDRLYATSETTGEAKLVGGGNSKANDALEKARGEGLGERYNTLAKDYPEAQKDAILFRRMTDLARAADPGARTAVLEQIRAMTGIAIDSNTDNVQAFKAISSYLAPRMRVPGSGASSDRDVAMFLSALPGLLSTPGGAEIISQTFEGITKARLQQAEIAQRWQRGEINEAQADNLLKNLPDPFEAFRSTLPKEQFGKPSTPPASGQYIWSPEQGLQPAQSAAPPQPAQAASPAPTAPPVQAVASVPAPVATPAPAPSPTSRIVPPSLAAQLQPGQAPQMSPAERARISLEQRRADLARRNQDTLRQTAINDANARNMVAMEFERDAGSLPPLEFARKYDALRSYLTPEQVQRVNNAILAAELSK